MADSTVVLILVAIIIVVGYFYGTQIIDAISNANNTFLQGIANNAVKTVAKPGQSVCTLQVNFHPSLSSIILIPPTSAQVNLLGGANKISWINCQGSPLANSLIPMQFVFSGDLNPLDFGQISATYHFNAVLVADDGTKLYPVVNPVPVSIKSITLQSTPLTPYGQSFDLPFTFLSVPRQHYILQLSSQDIGINQQDSGNVYNQNINP